MTALDVTLERSLRDLRDTGLTIDRAEEWWGASTFHDVGAVVYALRALPWEVPGFSVVRHESVLRTLQTRLGRQGALRFTNGRFIIAARQVVAP